MSDKMLTGCEAAFFLSACLVAPSPVSLSLNYIIKANFNAKINNSDEIMSQSVSALWPFFSLSCCIYVFYSFWLFWFGEDILLPQFPLHLLENIRLTFDLSLLSTIQPSIHPSIS